ncbi:MAG: glycosyltransferase [Planctomycetaceae bacterium]|nr:glycosyltransferase [Planctomycetaceae bacterium]
MSAVIEPVAAPEPLQPTKLVDLRGLKVAYLVNQYPQPSHTFIRREIATLEQLGATVERYTLRASTSKLVDPGDLAERDVTRAVLSAGRGQIVRAVLREFVRQPLSAARVLAKSVKLGRRSDRGVIAHLAYFAEACVLREWLKREQIEHVHAHFGTNAATVAMLLRWLGGPTYSFTVHGPEEFDKPEFLHLGEKVAHARFAVTISEFGRSQLCRAADYRDWHKIQVVHCGLDETFFDGPLVDPPETPRLLCVARLHEQKGLPVLIDAAELLRERGVAFQLDIIGDGPLRESLQQQIDERLLGTSVRLCGLRSGAEIRRELQASRTFVLPSFAEGLPVVIMEALAMHRPVISTYVAGIPELVEPGVSGWLVPAGNAEVLADRMQEALTVSVEQLATLGRQGAARVAERHRALTEAARLGELFTS